MAKLNNSNASKVVRVCRFGDQTDAMLEEWFSLPPQARNRRFIDTASVLPIMRKRIFLDTRRLAAFFDLSPAVE